MYFAILCFDRPGLGELREVTRPEHLRYLKEHHEKMHLGGPFENDEAAIIGTLFIINVESHAEAWAFTANEPFHKVGLFETVIVRRWRQMQPEVAPGANAGSLTEGEIQLKQEGIAK